MNVKCTHCKGSDPIRNCGRDFCPILARSEAVFRVNKVIQFKDFQGSSPAPFVGRFGYPNINLGLLAPPEIKDNAWEYDAPRYWSSHNYNIRQIIDFRSELINSNQKTNIKNTTKILDIAQQIGMSSVPVDVEVSLEDKPVFRLKTDSYLAPQGPNAKLKKAQITSNPKIHTKVDKVVSDTGLKATEAINQLYDHHFEENFLSKLLSVGILGIKKNRKLVPTRWSITAIDDILAKKMIEEIRYFPESDYELYSGSFLGNYYFILFFPEIWSYELFETYMPRASWNISNDTQFSTDFEPYTGRTSYAENCAGGYYTVRLAIAEKLKKIRKQASVLAFRIITGEYSAPLGVWVTREAARKAFQQKSMNFYSRELMVSYVKKLILNKFGYDIEKILKQSILLKNLSSQKKLTSFIN